MLKNPQIFRSVDYRVMPWKNGGGETREIAIWPNGASVTDSSFEWRLSCSTVCEDGPFSFFPGYDRYLTVTEGNGLILQIDSAPAQTLSPGRVIRFAGEGQVHCRLVNGRITDLNLIFKREVLKCDFILSERDSGVHEFKDHVRWSIVFVVRGTMTLTLQSTAFVMNSYETLLFDAEGSTPGPHERMSWVAATPGTVFCLIEIQNGSEPCNP